MSGESVYYKRATIKYKGLYRMGFQNLNAIFIKESESFSHNN